MVLIKGGGNMRKLKRIYFITVLMLSFCFALSPLAQEKKETEEFYTIKQGDTLWEISSKFLKDPFLWPKLWQRNPYITNPHWIYPGQPIRLSPIEEVKKEEPKKVAVEEKPKAEVREPEVKKVEPALIEKKPEEQPVGKKPEEEKPMVFPEIKSAGFVSDVDYRGIGIVLESKEGKSVMGTGDIVYVTFKTFDPILIGNIYTVFRASELIKHPVTDKKFARRYNIIGNIQIIDQYGKFFVAKVIEAFDGMFKGDMIRPYLKERMEIEERKK
jgi:hypothetical protein